jgi:hypothetical protein
VLRLILSTSFSQFFTFHRWLKFCLVDKRKQEIDLVKFMILFFLREKPLGTKPFSRFAPRVSSLASALLKAVCRLASCAKARVVFWPRVAAEAAKAKKPSSENYEEN